MTSPSTVVQEIFAVLHGQAAPVITRWTYLAEDPYAVTLAVQTRSRRWVEWTMGRDLLLSGLTGAAGDGDVRLQPCRVHGYDVILVEIESVDGHAVLEVDQDLLEYFVSTTLDAVPTGTETDGIDMDAEIAKITQTCAE